MTKFIDTEDAKIPKEHGRDLFDADLLDWGDGNGPSMSMLIPVHFETDAGTYDSAGVICANIQEILNDYLDNYIHQDGGIALPEFIAWLYEYADRLKKSYNNRAKELI